MLPLSNHSAAVDAWIKRNPVGDSPSALTALLIMGFTALWQRSLVTLGEVTLRAILERVLYTCSATFPWLKDLNAEAGGALLEDLRTDGLRDAEVHAGLRCVLVELLVILGNLTGDALTPQLRAELAKVTLGGRNHGDQPRINPAKPGKDE